MRAKVFIQNITNAFVRTDSVVGDYHRHLLAGTYNVIFRSPGYVTDTVRNIIVTDTFATRLDHSMKREITLVAANSSGIPEEFELHQNYPNPFNPVTSVRFDVPRTEFISLKIYDNLGKEISSLINSTVRSGSYEVKWNASNYPSGIYYCQFNYGSRSSVVTMVLIK
jgi:hypothetical protein